MDIKITKANVNIEALNAEVCAAFGEQAFGVSTGPYGVIVHLRDDVTTKQVERARQIVEKHDPSVLTAEQQDKADTKSKLDKARNENVNNLDVSKFSSESDLIQQLAQKIAWLELEIRTLHGDI